MPTTVLIRPTSSDYAEYYGNYIRLVPAGDLVDVMKTQITTLPALLEPIGNDAAGVAYAPGKWTVREVVGHLTDTERVFSYRATAFSRGDQNQLPSFDQAAWNPFGKYNDRALTDLLGEWADTRRSSLALVRSMPAEALGRRGVASGNEISVLSCICILAGHVNYHIEHLREHYRIGT